MAISPYTHQIYEIEWVNILFGYRKSHIRNVLTVEQLSSI